MSALGQKQTFALHLRMSAMGQEESHTLQKNGKRVHRPQRTAHAPVGQSAASVAVVCR
jgi:hypothetical protein